VRSATAISELSSHRVDPGAFLTAYEGAAADVVRDEGGADRRVPVARGDQRLGAMNPVPRGLDVDPRAGSQFQPDLAPALERATRERLS
jgi:hypothetical protein